MKRRLSNIQWLVRGEGSITIGQLGPIDCAATAASSDQSLAMLVRKPGESFDRLLERLDAAIGRALEHDEFIDEING